MIHKTFVGRGDELAKIREWIKGPSGKLVLITGPGGIGKTSLLSKIEKEYSANQDFVVEYFDLAEQPMTMLNQALHMAESLGRENFPQFVHFGASSDVSDPDVLEKKALAACVREVSAYLESRQKKLLRITDTFEIALKYKLYGDDWAKGINERLKDIPNTFFIIAGRDKLDGMDIISEIYPMLQDTFGKNNILHLPLSGFDKVEMEDFFSECDKHRMIPQEMRKKLQLLTEGRPILLSLAVEWLQKNIPLPVLIEKSFPELNELFAKEDERTKLRNAFEFELISNMRQLKTPLDVAALYMAHIDRRMDSKLLSVLLDVKQDDAEEDLEELLQLPFVKEYVGSNPKKCALHDEMCVLVKKHAWEPLDNIGVERKRLTRMVIDKYYIPYIDMLKEQKQGLLQETQSTLLQDVESRKINLERWLLETETLYYSLKLGNEEGYRYFDQVYYDEERTPVRDQILIDELKRAGAYDRDKIALRRADELLRRGQPDDARRECLVVLKNENIEAVDRIHSFNILGLADFESAPHSAETYFKRFWNLPNRKINFAFK